MNKEKFQVDLDSFLAEVDDWPDGRFVWDGQDDRDGHVHFEKMRTKNFGKRVAKFVLNWIKENA